MNSLSINFITSYYTCHPHYYYTHGALPPNRLKTRVVIILTDQTNKACTLNIDRDLGGIQSMSIVTIQLFADYKRAIKYYLTYLVFCITNKPLSAKE